MIMNRKLIFDQQVIQVIEILQDDLHIHELMYPHNNSWEVSKAGL